MILRNSLWHAAGAAIPALVALATIPLLIHSLGITNYGWLTLVTSIIGYFGALDINLTSGAIKYLSEAHATKSMRRVSQVFWFSATFYSSLGILVCLAITTFAAALTDLFGHTTDANRHVVILALQIGSLGFAIAQVQSVLMSAIQAMQRYDISARAEMIFGVTANLVSAAVAFIWQDLVLVVASRVVVSAVNCIFLIWQLKRLSFPLQFIWPTADVIKPLMSFSAYAYLSKLATTINQHADKLIIGALGGPVAITIYTVPITLAGRIFSMTSRLSSVLFPHASTLAATGRISEMQSTYLNALRYVSYLNFVVCAGMVLAGDVFLRHWVGEEFVALGYPVLMLMAFAILADSLTNIPSLINDALGHPRVTGFFALARGVVGISLVYLGMKFFGIVGAAGAHLLASVTLGAAFLIYVHGRTVPVSLRQTLLKGSAPLLVGTGILGVFLGVKLLSPHTTLASISVTTLATTALVVYGVAKVLTAEDRHRITARLFR